MTRTRARTDTDQASRPGSKPASRTVALGLAGEHAARAYLEAHGYTFCAARWRCRAGEIDLIMRHGSLIVFVEVRTRSGADTGAPFESITPRKQAKLIEVANAYLAEQGLEDTGWRIDAVGVTTGGGRLQVEVIENAVGW